MRAPMVVPVPTPMNIRPSSAIVKPRFSTKIIGNASNTMAFLASQIQNTNKGKDKCLRPNSRPYTTDK